MRVATTKPLFAWDCLEDHPSLVSIQKLLELIPDPKLLLYLEQARGRGRNDYPVRTLWGVLLLTVALRHTSFEACLAELRRNPSLAKLIGIESENAVPSKWNLSRFLQVLGQQPHRDHLRDIFNQMVKRLGEVVHDLGENTAGDSTALNARRCRDYRSAAKQDAAKQDAAKQDAAKQDENATQQQPSASKKAPTKKKPAKTNSNKSGKSKNQAQGEPGEPGEPGEQADSVEETKIEYDPYGLPQPSGGRKEYSDENGKVTKVVQWFGYKVHLLVDVKHEVTLAYQITSTKIGDNEVLEDLLKQGRANLPSQRIRTLAYDKAADDGKVHQTLSEAQVKPLIQIRSLWSKAEPERMLPGHDGNSNVVYDEAGTVYCYDKTSDPPVRHKMSYIGHEPSRGTLKFRCPAKHEGWSCPSESKCNAGKQYGMTVRVKQEIDLRRFPAIPRATKKFERLYKGRSAVERVNARLKVFWGADDGNLAQATRFYGFLGAVMVVHTAMATLLAGAPRREGTLGKMRLGSIQKALQAKVSEKECDASDSTSNSGKKQRAKTKKKRGLPQLLLF